MKSSIESTPELVGQLLASKVQLEHLQKELTSLNTLFSDLVTKGERPVVQQVEFRKKTKEEFTQIQQAYNLYCSQLPDYKQVLKQIRLGQLSLVDDGKSLSLVVNTPKSHDLSLSGLLPSSLGFTGSVYQE